MNQKGTARLIARIEKRMMRCPHKDGIPCTICLDLATLLEVAKRLHAIAWPPP